MSVLWTETPRHQAPTCPPQPGLLPESLSQSCQDAGPPGPRKTDTYPFRQTPPDALFFVSLAGGPPGSPAQPRVPPAPPYAPHPRLSGHRAVALPCPAPHRPASDPLQLPLGLPEVFPRPLELVTQCGHAQLPQAPSPAHRGAPVKAQTTASNKASVVTAQEGQTAGPPLAAVPCCGDRVGARPGQSSRVGPWSQLLAP